MILPTSAVRHLFITGTDTGVGKTHVACLLMEAFKKQGLRVVAMKPVAAGVEADGRNDDVRQLMAAANVLAPAQDVNPYVFAPPVAPHIAARHAGIEINLDVIARHYAALHDSSDAVVVEGAGGLLVPLNATQDMSAIPARLGLSVVLVVGMKLGCLNHALLSCEAITRRGLTLAGWVANCLSPDMDSLEENFQALNERISAPCWGRVAWSG